MNAIWDDRPGGGESEATAADTRPGWSWPGRLWLMWWLLVALAVVAGFAGMIQNQPAGGGGLLLGLLAALVTLTPWLTWYVERQRRQALTLALLSRHATLQRQSWSRGGKFWLVVAVLLPGLGILLGVLSQQPRHRDAAGALLGLWLLASIVFFLIFLAWLRRSLRIARALEASYLMNFTYTDQVPFSHKPPWRVLPLFERSKVQVARHVLEGEVGQLRVSVLEWADPEMALRVGRTGLPLVVLSQREPLPVFELLPRQTAPMGGQGWAWLHLLHGPFGLLVLLLHWAAHRYSQSRVKDMREVELDDPAFLRRYQLLSHDVHGADLLFSHVVCDYLLSQKSDWLLQSNGEQLLLCDLRGGDDPRKYPQLVAKCLELGQLMQVSYVEELATEHAEAQSEQSQEESLT